jgi:hypothetical protein
VELVVRQSGAACAVLGRKRLRGHEGLNNARFLGRIGGRPLSPGRYTITVVVVRAGKRMSIGTVAVEVVRSGRRPTRAERPAPASGACLGSTMPIAGASLLADLAGPLVATGAFDAPSQSRSKDTARAATPGSSFRPPTLLVPGGDGEGIDWALMLLYAGIAIGGGVLLVQFVRFFRDNWTA